MGTSQPPKYSTSLAILISGRGSNLQALLDKEGCNIRLVSSNKPSAPGLLKAQRFGIPTKTFEVFTFAHLQNYLKEKNIRKILLLGFMKILPENFINQWEHSMINLHPSLLPLYPGLRSIERSYKENSDMGVSLHHVIPAMDEGPLILQSKVFSRNHLPRTLDCASRSMAFREHFLVRKVVEKWS